MRKSQKALSILVFGFIFVFSLSGCGPKPVPIFMDPDFENMNFNTVTLIPVIDRRVDKSYEFNYEKDIGNRIEKKLKKYGYTVIRLDSFSEEVDIPNDEIAEMEAHELRILGNDKTEFMLVPYLDDASSKTALGYSFKIEVTGMLINKQSGSMLWKDKGIGSAGQGGLYGCMMAGVTRGEATNKSVNDLMDTFIKEPSKRK